MSCVDHALLRKENLEFRTALRSIGGRCLPFMEFLDDVFDP